jgi:hypothetical protein
MTMMGTIARRRAARASLSPSNVGVNPASPPIVLELELVLVLDPIAEFLRKSFTRSPRRVLLALSSSDPPDPRLAVGG